MNNGDDLVRGFLSIGGCLLLGAVGTVLAVGIIIGAVLF